MKSKIIRLYGHENANRIKELHKSICLEHIFKKICAKTNKGGPDKSRVLEKIPEVSSGEMAITHIRVKYLWVIMIIHDIYLSCFCDHCRVPVAHWMLE